MMKKTAYLFIVLFFGIQTISKAQMYSSKKGYVSISVGAAFPTGEFASTDLDSEEAGFAETGLTLNLINFGYLFNDQLGISASLSGSAHLLDLDTGDDTPTWAYGALVVGPMVSTQPTPELNLDARLVIGSMRATLDPDNGSGSTYEASSVAFGLGVGARYHVSNSISLVSTLDWISGNPEFEIGGTDFEQPIASISLCVGLALRI